MIDVALCIGTQHNPWLVALSVLICCAGAVAVTQMFDQAQATHGFQRGGWVFLSAVAAGATIWCTHFVAMIAYDVPAPIHLDPVLTIVSLIIAIIGSTLGFFIALIRWPVLPMRLLGGAVFGATIAAMHFTGMIAYRVDGIVIWRIPYVVTAILCALAFSAAAVGVLGSRGGHRHRLATGTGLLVTAIATLHFIAMTAMRVVPLRLYDAAVSSDQLHALALATALGAALVIAAGIAATLIDRRTRSDATRRLHDMAMNDALTGLPNRANFQQDVRRRIHEAGTSGEKLAVIAIDFDRFKEINDVHGHKAGDAVLVELASRMRGELQDDELVARLGGDEFVVLSRFSEMDALDHLANRLNVALRAPVDHGDFMTWGGASIGIAIMPQDGRDIETLLNNADLAMYRAKKDSALTPRYYDQTLDAAVRAQRELANDLRHAIENGDLEVHYQIQAAVRTRETTGFEALVRWNHPQRGPIPPSDFIPIAEEYGLILDLGEWVLRKACGDAAGWEHKSKVAVNVSSLQLAHADLPKLFHEILLETGLPPRRLEIELTESALMEDRDNALHTLRRLKALGISVALDDFGTGYSSLETLRIFPFDKIKLDRFFVSELEKSPQSTAIIRAVLALGKSLSIPVLAEGVESEQQLCALLQEGCDEVQGFLLGRPVPLSHVQVETAAVETVSSPLLDQAEDEYRLKRRSA